MLLKNQLNKELSILDAKIKRSLTDFTDFSKLFFSSSDSLSSITFSTPFFPNITGTPAYIILAPYFPFN